MTFSSFGRATTKRLATIMLVSCAYVLPASAERMDDEKAPSGASILQHEDKGREFQPPEEHARNLEAIEAHLEKHIGPIDTVFHEIVSDLIHLDVLYIPPTPERPYTVLATSGVSDLPMSVPEGLEDRARTELLIVLPEDWRLTEEAFEDDANYWPVRWLKSVGRLPHEYDTWLGWGHTIPNGHPPEPIADTDFIGVMVTLPYWLDPSFAQVKAENGDVINFYELVPLYAEEMDLTLAEGAEALEQRFDANDIGFVLDVNRPNVAKRKGRSRK